MKIKVFDNSNMVTQSIVLTVGEDNFLRSFGGRTAHATLHECIKFAMQYHQSFTSFAHPYENWDMSHEHITWALRLVPSGMAIKRDKTSW